MIPVFKKLEVRSEATAISDIVAHINAMQNELYECLINLTSENVTELSSDVTPIVSKNGSALSGDLLVLRGPKGETFSAGFDKLTGLFGITATDKDGNTII